MVQVQRYTYEPVTVEKRMTIMEGGNRVRRRRQISALLTGLCRLRTNTAMLVPVLPLMFRRAVFDQPALATDKAIRG